MRSLELCLAIKNTFLLVQENGWKWSSSDPLTFYNWEIPPSMSAHHGYCAALSQASGKREKSLPSSRLPTLRRKLQAKPGEEPGTGPGEHLTSRTSCSGASTLVRSFRSISPSCKCTKSQAGPLGASALLLHSRGTCIWQNTPN